jgi:hypothetical protein
MHDDRLASPEASLARLGHSLDVMSSLMHRPASARSLLREQATRLPLGVPAAEVPAVLNQSGVVKIRIARPAHDPPDGPGGSTRPPLSAATGKGRRLPSGFLRHGAFRPGDYQIVTAGSDNVLGLWVLPPCGGHPRHVTDRRYIEHHDGTVSIEGTLLFDGWEGSLEHGVWRASSGHALA